MSDRYWVGGSGTWSDVNHWSTSQGGSGGASVPTTGDTANVWNVAPSATINLDVDIVDLANVYFASFNGTFNTNGHSISVTNTFEVPTGTVNFGSTDLSVRRFFASELCDCSGMTLNLGANVDTPAVTCTLSIYSSGSARPLSTLNLRGSGEVLLRASSATYNINNFNVVGTNKIIEPYLGPIVVNVGTFSATGTAGNPITFNGDTYSLTFSKSSGTVNCEYLVLKNCHAIGGATWNAGINSVDLGGNQGWFFPNKLNAPFFGAAF